MKISKRTREQAWLICAIAASTPEMGQNEFVIGDALGAEQAATDLAYDAWVAVFDVHLGNGQDADENHMEACAEAAALLAEGWEP